MKKWLFTGLLLVTLTLTACSGENGDVNGNGNGPVVEEQSFTIAGSTSVAPVVEVMAEEYMLINENVQIHVQGGGSGAGVRSAQDGTAEVGMSSRKLNPDEEGTVQPTVIARDGIVVIANKDNDAVSNLTIDGIRAIYAGNITNWNEVGGDDVEITVVTREDGSGTRSAFEEIIMGDELISADAIVQGSTGSVKTAVENDPNALGYISLASLDDAVQALKVEGVKPTFENIQDGSYQIARPFLFLTDEQPEGAVARFIDFVLSADGQQIAQQEGLIPVK